MLLSFSERGKSYMLSSKKIKLLGKLNWNSIVDIEWETPTQHEIPTLLIHGKRHPEYTPLRTKVQQIALSNYTPSAMMEVVSSEQPLLRTETTFSGNQNLLQRAPLPKNLNAMVNPHVYDTKVIGLYSSSKRISSMSDEEKIVKLESFKDIVKYERSKEVIDLFISSIRSRSSYDNDNKIDTVDLALDVLLSPNVFSEEENVKKDLFDIVDEQMSDITELGPCHSGRTMRMLQVWRALV